MGEVWAGPHNLLWGMFFYVPEPKYSNFQQKHLFTDSGKCFVTFMLKFPTEFEFKVS